MSMGPVQLMLIKFDSAERFTGTIRKELAELRRRGLLRLIDLLFVSKSTDGRVSTATYSDLNESQAEQFGSLLKKMLGLELVPELTDAMTFDLVEESLGLSARDLPALASSIGPGEAALVLLIEHDWAARLRETIHDSGGRVAMQALLTRDALALIGGEVDAMIQAERTIELAEGIRGAAMLDALLAVAEAEDIESEAADIAAEDLAAYEEVLKNQVTAEVLHALAAAGVVDPTEVNRALDTLNRAGLLDDHALDAARAQVEQAHQHSGLPALDEPKP